MDIVTFIVVVIVAVYLFRTARGNPMLSGVLMGGLAVVGGMQIALGDYIGMFLTAIVIVLVYRDMNRAPRR